MVAEAVEFHNVSMSDISQSQDFCTETVINIVPLPVRR
uniref:Uncharacterized protein n=1 Tax=Rhizophora mucronata TaxID=61149 RepID=A0A2P2MXD2_RHIMU